MLFRTLFYCLMIGITATTQAATTPYYRFWRGWRLATVTNFRGAIRDTFVPATIDTGGGKGLIAYLPALPLAPEQRDEIYRKAGQDLPDEVALVAYESQKAYADLRATPEGKAYAELHWKYFVQKDASGKDKSKSLVPERYEGSVSIEHAYDLLGDNTRWMETESKGKYPLFTLYWRNKTITPDTYLALVTELTDKTRASEGLSSALILVSDDYWIEYQVWNKEEDSMKSRESLRPLVAQVAKDMRRLPILKHVPKDPTFGRFDYESAINVQFAIKNDGQPE